MLINASTFVHINIHNQNHSSTSGSAPTTPTTSSSSSSTTTSTTTTTSSTTSLTLTPYLPVHVRRYHVWMQDPTIRELTASEPLTLEEEYDMQRSWRTDHDKLTFIVYAGNGSETTKNGIDNQRNKHNKQLSEEGMVGDVNLFLFLDDDDGHHNDDVNNNNQNDEHANGNNTKQVVIGELELMLAELSARGRGLGSAVLLAFLMYVAKHERDIVAGFLKGIGQDEGGGEKNKINKIEYFRVRIAKDNIRSLKLFEGLGFKATSTEPNYFGELELRRYPLSSAAGASRGWEDGLQEMMREKHLEDWEEEERQTPLEEYE